MADISLTASMRSNLLSLQQTQDLMDMTQERLSTGKKVNSAIDNPSSYYTAQSLTNRASDLNALLDSMGQGIQTIQAANEGIEAITEFVQQAKALANTARDNATIKGVTSSGTYTSPTGADQTITVSVDGNENQKITFTIDDDATIEDAAEALQTALNDGTKGVKDADGAVLGTFTATVEKGQIRISNTDGLVATVSGTFAGITVSGDIGNSTRVTSMRQYNEILDQIDQLAKDSGYKGVNLLQGNDLKVIFNEDRSSYLTITGTFADTSEDGLNISRAADWTNPDNVAIEASITELEDAVTSLRNMASEFGNNYSIVENRENFTESLINVLEEGSDKLTLADMNEESANMLALQTRQQLAINSLSLASQAAQSVLSLF